MRTTMDKLNQLIERYTEGNYLIGKTAREEMAKDILALFNVVESSTQLKCKNCGVEDSIRWDKHTIGIDDEQGSYKDLSFQFCEKCGDVINVEFT